MFIDQIKRYCWGLRMRTLLYWSSCRLIFCKELMFKLSCDAQSWGLIGAAIFWIAALVLLQGSMDEVYYWFYMMLMIFS